MMEVVLAHPRLHATATPDKIAVQLSSGGALSYRELEDRSNRAARLIRKHGVERGDVVALFLENELAFFELAWACQRSGVYFVPISSKLLKEELGYILADSGAKLLFLSNSLAEVAEGAGRQCGAPLPVLTMEAYEKARDAQPALPVLDESAGVDMVYSSGTTGRPKGVKPALPEGPVEQENRMTVSLRENYRVTADSRYLSPSPLYHAAPLRWCMTVQRIGGTVIVLDRFDAEAVLRLIEQHRITHAQFVPTHFARLLNLPVETRRQYDHASLHIVVHAAAPCPRHVKEAMFAWWGPIIHEYYGGSEGNGVTIVSPQDWLNRPGTVGKPSGCVVRICGDDGEPLPQGETGLVYFAGGAEFEYHNDPEKTAQSRNRFGWTTLGDVGHVDEDDFLFLTDRKSFMIISGGVNIYPQEIEDALIKHPAVVDAAVVASPNTDLGEEVAAVIQPHLWEAAGPELANDIRQHLAGELSRVKLPRRIDFIKEMPRLATGKLMKRHLRDAYFGERPDIAASLLKGMQK